MFSFKPSVSWCELSAEGTGEKMLERYLNQLTAELDLGEPPPKDKQNSIKLTLNPDLAVTFKELDPGLYLFSPLGECPKRKKSEVFTLMMQANFLGQGTGGGILGLDEDEKYLTLSLTLPYDMNYRTFKETLSDFANYVDYWKEEVKRLSIE